MENLEDNTAKKFNFISQIANLQTETQHDEGSFLRKAIKIKTRQNLDHNQTIEINIRYFRQKI